MTEPGSGSGAGGEPGPGLPRSLLRAGLADPEHLPEHLAWFALRHMGPAADRAVARVREQHPDAGPAELRALVVARGRRNTVAEGAFVGGPFLLLVPVAFCAALLNQARTVLELAGLDGRDPTSPERAAELLVLMGVHPDTEAARRALVSVDLDRVGRTAPRRALLRPAALRAVTVRMARLLGLVSPPGDRKPDRGRLRGTAVAVVKVLLVAAVFAVGLVAPLVWLPYMALSYHWATGRLADRAALFYFSEPAPRRAGRTVPGLTAAYAKAVVSMLLPALLTVLVLVVGVRIEHSHWPVVTMALALASLATGAWWQSRHRSRRSRTNNDDDDGDGAGRGNGGEGP
ncbi:hypothetical protein ACFYXL_32785 [Streptomyces tsukubensis]|uniref:hypothetical protein n=1 Tax=Streptomyces tsukubensis TaxID=83656 RepID=UPI00369A0A30